MYILLSGYPPFNGYSDQDILEAVSVGKFDFDQKEWEEVSSLAKDLISKMLTYNSNKRPSAQKILEHEWFTKYTKEVSIDAPALQNVLKNMKDFRNDMKLQEGIWTFIVTKLATKDEKNELLEMFKALDTNGDGQLSREELYEGYKKIYGEAQAFEEVDAIMAKLDKNNSGTIDYSGFSFNFSLQSL